MKNKVTVLSLGAGVQSSTLLMLYETGKLLPRPDFAIFADTMAEPESVYTWLEFLKTKTTLPIHIVSHGNLETDFVVTSKKTGKPFVQVPFYMMGKSGREVLGLRQCTAAYKLNPIYKGIREILGYKKYARTKHKVDMIVGISTDEISRMKESRMGWVTNKYPLIEKLDWSRQDCLKYFDKLGWSRPPRSACYFCPYKSNDEWIDMRDNEPEEWKKAVEFDKNLRKLDLPNDNYLHFGLKPLDEVTLKAGKDTPHSMENECEGMCGV